MNKINNAQRRKDEKDVKDYKEKSLRRLVKNVFISKRIHSYTNTNPAKKEVQIHFKRHQL